MAEELDENHFARPDLLAERLADWIRDEIVSGRMAPGERLVEQTLSKRCNVSRVPLREALRIVAADGLLVLAPHRGAIVTQLSESELSELFDLRIALEGFAAAAVARLKPIPDLSALRQMNKKMGAFIDAGDHEGYRSLATTFHAEMVTLAQNELLATTYNRIKNRFSRYQAALSKIPQLPSQSVTEHTAILDAMEKGDAELARNLAEKHIRRLVASYRESRN